MKLFSVLLLLFSMVSCQYFDKQVPDEKELLEQELKKINWDEVDEFPSVLQCDTIKDVEIKKQCFFDYLAQTIQERIGIDTLRVEYPEIDTINVKITVNPDSSLQFETQNPNDSIALADKTKIDSILTSRLSDFPKVEPAIKKRRESKNAICASSNYQNGEVSKDKIKFKINFKLGTQI